MKYAEQIQNAHTRAQAFTKEYPEWTQQAREAMRPWERGEELLITAIGKALQAAYVRGQEGDYPENCNQLQNKQPATQRIRRPRGLKRPPVKAPARRFIRGRG